MKHFVWLAGLFVVMPGCLRFSVKQKPNLAPTIVTVADLAVAPLEAVVLDASSSSDPEGDALTYTWSVVDTQNDPITLTGANTSIASFAAPDRGQRLFVKLQVSDGAATSEQIVFVRVNEPPRILNDRLMRGKAPFAIEAVVDDADSDVMTEYRWELVSAPDGACAVASDCLAQANEAVLTLSGPPGAYVVELTVNDGLSESVPVNITIELGQANRAPVVGFDAVEAFASEDLPFALDASRSFDPDGLGVTVSWRRVSGSDVLPASAVGSIVELALPAWKDVVNDSTTWEYEATVSDGELTSVATMQLHLLPGSNYVIVSDSASANDSAVPACGSIATPCRTIDKALALIDPNNDQVGDGRDLILTSGNYSTYSGATRTPWKSGASVYGSRDPRTFDRGSRTVWLHENGGCHNPVTGIYLSPALSSDVVFFDFDFNYSPSGCLNRNTAFDCDGCSVGFKGVAIKAMIPPSVTYNSYARGLFVRGGGAIPTVKNTTIEVGLGNWANVGVEVWSGSQVALTDVSIVLAAENLENLGDAGDTAAAKENTCLHLEAGSATLERVTCVLKGNVSTTFGPTAGVVSDGGTLVAKNSVIATAAGDLASGVSLLTSAGSASLQHLTIVGSNATTGSAAAINANSSFSMLNSLVAGFAYAARLNNASALAASLDGNVMSAGVALGHCNGTDTNLMSELQAASPSLCNQSGPNRTANQAATCGLIDTVGLDFHLNPSQAAACINQGVMSAAAGIATTTDLDGEARSAPDVGADEVF